MSAQPVAGGAGDAERKIGFLRDGLRRLSSGTAGASTWPGVAERFQSLRALDERRFAPEQQAAIEHLCPRTVTHAVVSRGRADLSRHPTPGE